MSPWIRPTPLPFRRRTLSEDDVDTCIRVLRAIERDRAHLTVLTQERRRELLTLAGLVAKPERRDLVRMAKAFRRAEREAAKAHDQKLVDQSGLRVQRRSPVYAPLRLEPPAPDERRRPSGAESTSARATSASSRSPKFIATTTRCARRCGDFNYAKREQTADLDGRYALVTGARVKIGYQASLKLLRAGAHVVVTTRFPVDAVGRYAKEPDFAEFRKRLQIYGLDLRHTPSVELFTHFLVERLPRLDYILNNACQTVRRPAGFFQHLLDGRSASRSRRSRRNGAACSRARKRCGARCSASPRARRAVRSRRTAQAPGRRSAAQRRALAAALSRRGLRRRRGAVSAAALRRGSAASRPARREQLAAAPRTRSRRRSFSRCTS